MKTQEIRDIARRHQIKASGLSKTVLIRKIQQAEGNFACFATTSNGACDQSGCLWRDECFSASTQALH